jgi:hypothetical protein
MMNTISKWPLNPNMKNILQKEFDNGLVWTKEALNGMILPPPTPIAPDVEGEVTLDAAKEAA